MAKIHQMKAKKLKYKFFVFSSLVNGFLKAMSRMTKTQRKPKS